MHEGVAATAAAGMHFPAAAHWGMHEVVALLMAKEGAKAVAIVHLPKEQPVRGTRLPLFSCLQLLAVGC